MDETVWASLPLASRIFVTMCVVVTCSATAWLFTTTLENRDRIAKLEASYSAVHDELTQMQTSLNEVKADVKLLLRAEAVHNGDDSVQSTRNNSRPTP